MRSLLDVNVLLALFDQDHVHHDVARDWLTTHGDDGWATCPITENGFVRVLSQPAYPGGISTPAAIEVLSAARGEAHEFWPADVSVLDTVRTDRVHGPRQVTDLYLLALAVRHDGRFVTFDDHVPRSAVPGATADHLVVVGSA